MSNGANLPRDIIADILSRLPAKLLCTFKCVSKPWRALISNPYFNKKHMSHNNPREKLIISSSEFLLYSIDFYDKSADHDICSGGGGSGGGLVAEAIKLEFATRPNEWVKILGSCNGLLLGVNKRNGKFLLNPSTRESETIPKLPHSVDFNSTRVIYGFGYDSSTDDYKVVAISYNHTRHASESELMDNPVDVYSIRTRQWRRVGKSCYDHPGSVPWQGVFLNGSLHWLALTYRNGHHFLMIAAFDLADEQFKDVEVPAELDTTDNERVLKKFVLFYDLLILGGCLCIVACCRNRQTDIWMMKDYGVRDSWTKFCTIYGNNLYPIRPIWLIGEWEILLYIFREKMVIYNFKEETSRDVAIGGLPSSFEVGATFIESLASVSHAQLEQWD